MPRTRQVGHFAGHPRAGCISCHQRWAPGPAHAAKRPVASLGPPLGHADPQQATASWFPTCTAASSASRSQKPSTTCLTWTGWCEGARATRQVWAVALPPARASTRHHRTGRRGGHSRRCSAAARGRGGQGRRDRVLFVRARSFPPTHMCTHTHIHTTHAHTYAFFSTPRWRYCPS